MNHNNSKRYWKFLATNELKDNMLKHIYFIQPSIRISNLGRYYFEDALDFEDKDWRLPFYREINLLMQNPHRFYNNGILFENGLFLPYNSNNNENFPFINNKKLKCNQCIFWIGDFAQPEIYNDKGLLYAYFKMRMSEYIILSRKEFRVVTHSIVGSTALSFKK